MHTVLLYGEEKNCAVTNALLAAIRKKDGSALHITSKTVSMIPPQAKALDFLLLDGFPFENLHVGRGVVVFRRDIPFFTNVSHIPENFFAVADPTSEDAVRALKKSCMQAVTCGFSRRDTLTFSSFGGEEAVVSLQRALTTLDGEQLEPREIPVRLGGEPEKGNGGEYAVLAAAAVLLLCGEMPDGGFSI